MTKKLPILLITILGICSSTTVYADAYIRGATAPWGESTNEAAMDAVFGSGNWDDLRMADGAGPFTPGVHDFIFLEGGDGTAVELANYLDTHRAAIENYVAAGGRLLLNSAPNEGGNIDYGFGGVALVYPGITDSVTAANSGHPIFSGPFTPVTTNYTGDWFGHALVGGNIGCIIVGQEGENAGQPVLAEMDWGAGKVLFGGMTTDNFHDPQPEAANLRANIISYADEGVGSSRPCGPTPVPSLNTWGLAILVTLLLLVGFNVRREIFRVKQ